MGQRSLYGDGTGTIWARHRYLRYVKDGSVFDNPLFPSDIYSGIPPANKDWYAFADQKPADHQPRWFNDENHKMNPDDPNSII